MFKSAAFFFAVALLLCAADAQDVTVIDAKVVMVGEKQTTSGPAVQDCVIERFKLHSAAMNREIDVVVVLPPAYQADPGARFPVLIALHGRRAPYDMWANMKPLRQALATQPMIVASFSGDESSWYIDSPVKADSQFATFALKEFIPFIDRAYCTKGAPANRGIAGISMGGFGAMHLVLTEPSAFASVSGISGAYDGPGRRNGFETLLGDYDTNKAAYDKLDIPSRLKAAAAAKVALPQMQITCGTEDRLLASSQRLETLLKELGLAPEYLASAGAHDWPYWRDISPKVIDFHWRIFKRFDQMDSQKKSGH